MKITHLLEGSEAGMPSPSQPAPKFGRSDVAIEETTVAGNVGGGAPSNMGMQRRGQGSMFQGIKTSKKFANTPVTEDDISEEHISAKQRREEFFNKSQSRDIGNRPQDKDILPKQTHESDGEYDDEAGMIKTNLHTSLRAIKGLHKTIGDSENCPEWVQEKIAVASDYLITCWDYMISQHEQGRKYEMNEGYYSNQDNNRTVFRKPRPDVTEGQWKDIDGASAPPKGSKLQIKTIEPGSAIRVDPKYKEPTAPVAPKDNGMGRIVQGTWQADPKGTVKAPSGDPEGVKEVAPPGSKAERMVKHIKKSYSKDGKITPKEKSIAYATAWKAHNKGKVEEQGVAEAVNGRNRNYSHGFASPNAPSLGGHRHREDDEGWDREEREQRQNWYIRIDGKLLKDKQQQPYTFSGKQAAEKAARTMMAKDFNKNKKFTLTTSWMDAPEQGVKEESKGLWANIHAKRERIKHGSGEKMRKPGSSGAPTASALRKSAK